MTDRPPLTRTVIAAAQEHAWGADHARVIVWHPQAGYFDTDDTLAARRRFVGQIVALVSRGGHVEKIKPCKKCRVMKARRAK